MRHRHAAFLAIALAASLLALALSACQRQKPRGEALPSPSPMGIDESPLRLEPRVEDLPASEREAVVAYLEGRAEAIRGGERFPIDIDERLLPGDLVSTGPSSACEIRLGGITTLRLGENSQLAIDSLLLSSLKKRVGLSLRSGTLLGKVNKLMNPDSFVLRGPSMVCGVRGTRFALQADESGATFLAVDEGRVKALPASPILDGLADAAKSNGVARAALAALLSLGPDLGPGMELSYGAADTAAAEKTYAKLAAVVSASRPEPIDPAGGLAGELAGMIPAGEIVVSDSAAVLIEAGLKGSLPAFGKARPASARAAALLAGFSALGAERPANKEAPTAKPLHPSILGVVDSVGAPIVGDIVQYKGLVLISDSSGGITAFDASGKAVWRAQTGNSGSRHSYPIVFKDKIYYSGSQSFDVIDGRTGAILSSKPNPADSGYRDGLRPYQFPGGILSPRENAIDIVSAESGDILDSLEVPEGLMMTPAAFKSKTIVYVTSTGLFRLVQASDKKVVKEIQTEARGISRQSLRNRGNLYFFADGNGMAVLVDTEADEPVWQRRVEGALTAEAEMGKSAVYLPTENGLAVLGISDGETLALLPGISGPPLLSNDTLFLCTDSGELIVARANPYSEIRRISLPFVGAARPLIVGKTLWVAGRGGKMVRIDPELLKKEPRAGS